MKKTKYFLLLIFAGTLAWTSCKKGDTGPAGPAGPAGPDSVVYTPWVQLAFNYIPVDTSGYYSDSISAPSITKSIIDSGVVLGYLDISQNHDGSIIIPMSTAGTIGVAEFISVGWIEIEAPGDGSNWRYRYVSIPGSKLAGTNSAERKYNGYTITELKSMSYEKAKSVAAMTN